MAKAKTRKPDKKKPAAKKKKAVVRKSRTARKPVARKKAKPVTRKKPAARKKAVVRKKTIARKKAVVATKTAIARKSVAIITRKARAIKTLTKELATPVDEILEGLSEYYVSIGHDLDLSKLVSGDKIIYLAGKIFETEYVPQDVIVDSDPKGKASEFASAGDGKIKGAYRNVSGGNGAIWWRIPKDLSSVQEALNEEWSSWEIRKNDLFEVKNKEIKANVSYEGSFGEREIALVYPDGILRDPPRDSESSAFFMGLSLEDNDEAEEKLEEESEIIGYSTGDNPYLAAIITRKADSFEVGYWVLPDNCYMTTDILKEVKKLWAWLKEELS